MRASEPCYNESGLGAAAQSSDEQLGGQIPADSMNDNFKNLRSIIYIIIYKNLKERNHFSSANVMGDLVRC